MERNTRLAGGITIVALLLGLAPAVVHGQDARSGAEDGDSDATQELERKLEALRQELEAQRAELEAQRAELEAQREQRGAAEGPSDEEAQLEAILDDVESGEEREGDDIEAFEPSFRLYGFADMGLQRFWGTGLVETAMRSNALSFVLGNVNIYFDAQPARDWRFLTEVRLSLLPDGTEDIYSALPIVPEDSMVLDPTSPSLGFREVRLGSIILERSHIDYQFRDWLNVRVGLFLTPVGIWNVDHGTPTLISTTFPGFQVLQLFPERQLGVELFGSFLVGDWELAYHAYVSNGRQHGQIDLTDDKAGGFRLVARTRRPIPIQLGVSGYAGSFESGVKVLDDGNFAHRFDVAYKEQALAADISIDIEDLRIRAEWMSRRIVYDDDKRGTVFGSVAADRIDVGAYFLAAYRLPWAGLEPFVFLDFLKFPVGSVGEASLLPSAGLNIHFSPEVVLKFQYSYMFFFDLRQDLPEGLGGHLHLALSRLAIAF
ncbi:MAG: hypothetical protein ACODAU_07110 [Myxococcota bacterium]